MTSRQRIHLKDALRLIVITDAGLAAPRSVTDVLREALEAGARCVQLRDKTASARNLVQSARALTQLAAPYGALVLVNDRLDVAMAAEADGVHVGPTDLPVRAVRRVAGPGFLIGYSTDDPNAARAAVEEGADYIGCGTVFPTTSKPDAGDAIGPDGLERVVRSVDVPVVGIGGVTPDRVAAVLATGAAGVAVIGAVMGAPDPGGAVRRMLVEPA